uniref:MFS-type transporter efuF n=1 Tax=Hormonema carpetanum TaxID=284138 RepID=EFUF_HORCR|nr:RecName: Full=MFS-type transporter efuF; AltName: Full=Enfumafungin biosynthesis cluster protein F [Hormonema carpetanum]AWW17215.1 transporter [Hormonema carpetanum]
MATSVEADTKSQVNLKVANDGGESASETGVVDVYDDPLIHNSIRKKLDLKLLPLLSAMYLFNAIDRSNLGNAKTDGLEKDLHMKGNEYSITLVLFYVTFCLLDVPANMLLKKFSGKIMLPTLMMGWGSMTLIQCAVHNWGGLIACRLLMGAFEAGFMAGVVYYLTTFYRRNELALRISIFYGAATIAGAFSGLLAYGVFQINHPSIPGWKFLMIIEGSATILLASFAYWHLPSSVLSCKWFTEEEKHVAEQRMLHDGSIQTDEKFALKTALANLLDWKIALYAVIGISYGVASASVGNFLPQMVQRLGFGTVKTNLYTVAPYCVGCVILLAQCTSSDHFRERSTHLAGAMLLTFVGFILLITLDTEAQPGPTYFACFLLAAGAFTPSCIFHSWHNNNTPSENGRAAVTGFMVGASNSGGIISSLAFASKTAPKYIPALIVTATFQGVGIVLVLGFGAWFRWDNRRRDRVQGVRIRTGDVATVSVDDASWRWTA